MMIQGFYAYKKTSTISYVKESQAEINVYVLISNCVVLSFFCVVGEGFPPSTRSVYYTADPCIIPQPSAIS